MTAHAFFSPSGAAAAMLCPGKPAMEEGRPDPESPYAAQGTLAHELAARLLTSTQHVELPDDIAEGVRAYVRACNERWIAYQSRGAKPTFLIEQRLPLTPITGEANAFGTADCIIIAEFPDGHSEMAVIDLKFGMGVEVEVMENPQLIIYALAAVLKYQMLNAFTEVTMVIHQPRVTLEPSEWTLSINALLARIEPIQEAAQLSLSLRDSVTALNHLNPGEAQCRFCRAKAVCPRLAETVHAEVFGELSQMDDEEAKPVALDLESPQWLSMSMRRIGLIEEYCTAVRAEVERQLLKGTPIPGYKLVEGKRGNRKWDDEEAVQALLVGGGVHPDAIFNRKLKTPADLEKQLKKDPVWKVLEPHINQSEGRPSVADATDKRKEYKTADDDFTDLTKEELA